VSANNLGVVWARTADLPTVKPVTTNKNVQEGYHSSGDDKLIQAAPAAADLAGKPSQTGNDRRPDD